MDDVVDKFKDILLKEICNSPDVRSKIGDDRIGALFNLIVRNIEEEEQCTIKLANLNKLWPQKRECGKLFWYIQHVYESNKDRYVDAEEEETALTDPEPAEPKNADDDEPTHEVDEDIDFEEFRVFFNELIPDDELEEHESDKKWFPDWLDMNYEQRIFAREELIPVVAIEKCCTFCLSIFLIVTVISMIVINDENMADTSIIWKLEKPTVFSGNSNYIPADSTWGTSKYNLLKAIFKER